MKYLRAETEKCTNLDIADLHGSLVLEGVLQIGGLLLSTRQMG